MKEVLRAKGTVTDRVTAQGCICVLVGGVLEKYYKRKLKSAGHKRINGLVHLTADA